MWEFRGFSAHAGRLLVPELPYRIRDNTKRYQRKGLGYSKDLETHKAAVAVHFGLYNFVRKHTTLGTTPAVAAGVELEPWDLEQVVEMTAAYIRQKEDAKFEAAFVRI